MRTLLRGDWVVGWNGAEHELVRDGVCVLEDDTVAFVGKSYEGAVDQEYGGRGCLISPGLISTHAHTNINADTATFLDQNRRDIAGRNYMNWQAVVLGTRREEPDPGLAARFGLAQCARSGITTVLEIGARNAPAEFIEAVDDIGIRAYTGLSYRNAQVFSQPNGSLVYQWQDEIASFRRAIEFAEACDANTSSRVEPLLCPGHADTCSVALLEETRTVAEEQGWPITIHAGLHLREYQRVFDRHRCTPFELLHRLGLIGPRVIIGHAVLHSEHSLSPYLGQDVELLASKRAVVSHSPLKYFHIGMLVESIQRYADAGIQITIGTDFPPRDILTEMRLAMLGSRVADNSFMSGTPRLVFDGATVNAADALARPDLGRLAPGTKADVVVFDLNSVRYGAIHDPIRTLVEQGSAHDVRWSFVDGRMVVNNGVLTGIDEALLVTESQEQAERLWNELPQWYPGGRTIDELYPPSYAIK